MRLVSNERAKEIRGELVKQHAVMWLHIYPQALEKEILKTLEDAAATQGRAEVLKEIIKAAEAGNPQDHTLDGFFTSEAPLEKQ